eukprot:s2199_g11.t1
MSPIGSANPGNSASPSNQRGVLLPSPNLSVVPPLQAAPSGSEPWKEVFDMMENLAPRVGNSRVAMSHAVAPLVQQLVPALQVHVIYVCRDTERFQVPLDLPDRENNAMRHTICLHRNTGQVHDLGCENWYTLKRSQRIRNAMPSKLMITCFGTSQDNSAPVSRPAEPERAVAPDANVGAPCPVKSAPPAVAPVPSVSQQQVCEGWAPPPIALHGPKFRELSNAEKADLRRLHVNLGHPDPAVLAEHLKAQNAAPHVIAAAKEFVCDACVESVGRVERHGQIIKRMLTRFDQERPIESLQDFDRTLLACFQAKNSLMRHQGYSPEQIVLGKSKRLPASLSSDENAIAHAAAAGEEPESEVFRRTLETRTIARKSFLLTDNDNAMRRALLRRSCPIRGPYQVGQLVMYWIKNHRASRHEAGRWYGPAKVILQESPSAVWLSHAERLFKCAPESIRPASLREWNMVHHSQSSWVPEPQDDHSDPPPIPHSPQETDYEPSILQEPIGNINRSPTITPHSSVQPESELFPEPPDANNTIPPTASETPNHPHAPSEPIGLDPNNVPEASPADESTTANDAVPILHCYALQDSDVSNPTFEWTELHPGTSPCDVLLAEDGMPVIRNPLECEEHQCFALSVEITEGDMQRWAESPRPEEMAWLASASKRARAEVSVKTLNLEEKVLFEKAKDAELNCWIQTSALKPILRKQLNPDQILKSRWILTWKAINEEDPTQPQRKAKARLVVLGYQDPQLCNVARDSPTLTREGRHSVLQTIASQNWLLSSFDIKTAFLRGQADRNNPLAMEPPAELRKKLNMSQEQVCALVGNAYGRVDAPLLFYKEFSKQLEKLHFRRHPLEPCVYMLETMEAGKRRLHGIIGTHVDDGICGGDEFFHLQLEGLKKVLPFGSFKQRKFVFTGIHLEQLPDFSIMASQEEYVKKIPAIDIGRPRRQTPESPVTDSELNKLRGVIGSLQYAVTHTRPDMAAKLGEVQVQVSNATVQTLLMANRVLREAQEQSQVKICFRSIPVDKVTHVSFGDASFASAKQLASFQGTLICATDMNMSQNRKAPISPLTWTSKKIARVVRSTLSAEAYAMSNSVDRLGWMRLLWGTINVPQFNWREPKLGFQSLPKATIVTDCKSLYDLVSRTAMPSCEEFRTTLEDSKSRKLVFDGIDAAAKCDGVDVDKRMLDGRKANRGFTISTGTNADPDFSSLRNSKRAQTLPADCSRRGDFEMSEDSKKQLEEMQKHLLARYRHGSVSVVFDVVPQEVLDETFKNKVVGHSHGLITEGQQHGDERERVVYGTIPLDPPPLVACQKGCKGFKDTSPNQDNFSVTHFKSGYTLVCTFDGHGPFGHIVSTRTVQTVPWFMVNESGFDKDTIDEACIEKALINAFEKAQKDVVAHSLENDWDVQASGSTAVAALFKGNKVWTANAGDSRCAIGSEAASWQKKYTGIDLRLYPLGDFFVGEVCVRENNICFAKDCRNLDISSHH